MNDQWSRIKIYVDGMTCSGCENRIQERLGQIKGIKKVRADSRRNISEVWFEDTIISSDQIVESINNLGYKASLQSDKKGGKLNEISRLIGMGTILYLCFQILKRIGLFEWMNIFPEAEAGMGYGMLFIIGLLTSVHCIAMCGGINLSQCMAGIKKSDQEKSRIPITRSALLYHSGRVVSYTIIGVIVGAMGSVISFSGAAKGAVQIAAGILMIWMGLGFLDVVPESLKLRIPVFPWGRKIKNKKEGASGSFLVGLLNGLMPCGPLQTMQLYALSTANPVKGGLSMLFFSLGTVPLMMLLGMISTGLSRKFTKQMMAAGAVLMVLLGGSMFQNGFHLSGFATAGKPAGTIAEQAQIQGDKQIVRTTLSRRGYEPITVNAGVPVQWIITADYGSITGCNNRIFIPEYGIEKKLQVGENVIEFTPEKEGVYRYSCWMGMIRSTITVTSKDENTTKIQEENGQKDSCFLSVSSVEAAEKKEGKQIAVTTITENGYEPSVLVLERGVETEWVIRNEYSQESSSVMLVKKYQMMIPLEEEENPMYLVPEEDFDFTSLDYQMKGYIKVVDSLDSVDLDIIKQEASQIEIEKWDYWSEGGFGGCCQ